MRWTDIHSALFSHHDNAHTCEKGRARRNTPSPASPCRADIPSALFSRHDSARIPVKRTNSAQRAFSRHSSGGASVKKDTPGATRFLPLPRKRFPAPARAAGTTKPQISGLIPPPANSKHSVFRQAAMLPSGGRFNFGHWRAKRPQRCVHTLRHGAIARNPRRRKQRQPHNRHRKKHRKRHHNSLSHLPHPHAPLYSPQTGTCRWKGSGDKVLFDAKKRLKKAAFFVFGQPPAFGRTGGAVYPATTRSISRSTLSTPLAEGSLSIFS